MQKKYANPPIVEALCEFRLDPDTPWDLTVPGRFYEKIKEDFPHREQRLVQQIEISQQGRQVRMLERVLFLSPDRKCLVQLSPHLLVVNILKPYPSWEGFKPRIVNAWDALQEVIDIKGVERIGLRYINHIQLPEHERDLRRYFEFYPCVGSRLPQEWSSFTAGAEFPYEDERDQCRIQLISAESRYAVNLDIDYFLARPGAITVSTALDWIEGAHGRVEEVFEGCITEKLRSTFEEVT